MAEAQSGVAFLTFPTDLPTFRFRINL